MSATASKSKDVHAAAPTTSGRLFFLDLGGGRVLSANPDGSDLKTIISEGRKLPDGLVVDPFQGKPPVRKIAGYSHASEAETQTAIIPDEILGPLVRLALEYVDSAADYLFDALHGIEGIRKAGRNFEYRANRYLRGLGHPSMDWRARDSKAALAAYASCTRS